jgi:hypothetical protein
LIYFQWLIKLNHKLSLLLLLFLFSHETVSAYIDRLEARKLQADDLGLPQNDIKKTFLDCLRKPIRDKMNDGPKPRSCLEAKTRVKDVVEDDGLTVKGQANSIAGLEAYVKVLESQLTEMRQENQKMMSLLEKMMEKRKSTPSCLRCLLFLKLKDLGLSVLIVQV